MLVIEADSICRNSENLVVPAKAGTHLSGDVRSERKLDLRRRRMGPRFRGGDKFYV
jgi:hypothetical protein